jgi:hypothetical protein
MTDASVRQTAAGYVNLVSIVMLDCPRLSWEALAAVGQYCGDLGSRSSNSCLDMKIRGIRAVVDGCIPLRSIDIGLYYQLTDA